MTESRFEKEGQTAALQSVNALLEQFTHFGMELGLERIQRLLNALGNPQNQIPIVHVAGSNGKGSVCAFLASVLIEAGYRVGRYTSPHLISWCERISLDGRAIAPEVLHQTLQRVIHAIDPNFPSPTQFEIITAAAWLYFAEQSVDIAVMEVGLGGRLDATNVCDRPLVSVITSLSREHWQKLGPTLGDIAGEKAGILKESCPAVIAPLPSEADRVIRQRLSDLHCPTVWVQPSVEQEAGWVEWRDSQVIDQGAPQSAASNPIRYRLPLPGRHQLTNSATAIATLRVLQHQGWEINEDHICEGIGKTQWAARMQWFPWQGRELLIDAAHNPAGAEVLRDYVDKSDRIQRPVQWVMGLLSTKDHGDIFRAMLRPNDSLHLVPVPDHLSADLEQLTQIAWDCCPNLAACTSHNDVESALTKAFQQAEAIAPSSTVILCGSIYLIGHFFSTIGVQVR